LTTTNNMPMRKKKQITNTIIILLTVEKTIQHLLLGLAFAGLFSGVEAPYIGPNFAISNFTMALLNLFYALFFVIGLFGIIKRIKWGMPLIITLAGMDILLEFLFHGLFYITVSVIVSTILIVIAAFHIRMNKDYVNSIIK
jgi:hypothetical protein